MMSAGPPYLKPLASTVRFGGVGGFFAYPEVTAKELEFILVLRSNDPAIGYNRWPKAKDVSKAPVEM